MKGLDGGGEGEMRWVGWRRKGGVENKDCENGRRVRGRGEGRLGWVEELGWGRGCR